MNEEVKDYAFINIDDPENKKNFLMSKYMFIETLNDNFIEFIPVYRNSNAIYPGFDSKLYRIIYEMFEIQKDTVNYQISSYKIFFNKTNDQEDKNR